VSDITQQASRQKMHLSPDVWWREGDDSCLHLSLLVNLPFCLLDEVDAFDDNVDDSMSFARNEPET